MYTRGSYLTTENTNTPCTQFPYKRSLFYRAMLRRTRLCDATRRRACCVDQESRVATASTASDLWTTQQVRPVDTLVLITSPTTLCVVPVTCNNKKPILQVTTWRILWTNVLNLYAELSQCCTVRNKNSEYGWICVFCVPRRRGSSKQAPINDVPVVNPTT